MNDTQVEQRIFLGTFQIGKEEEAKQLLESSLDMGIRCFDTAPSYGTEKVLGKVISEALKKGSVDREEIVICDKIDGWQMQQNATNIEMVVDRALRLLGVEYIDIMLIHWPFKQYFEKTWDGLQRLKGRKVKKIGFCNVDQRIYLNLMQYANGITPEVVQIERHPYNACCEFVEFLRNESIMVQAYSPICRMKFSSESMDVLRQIGDRYQKSAGQVVLRWHIDTGVSPVVKSNKTLRILENKDIFDFQLDEEEINSISAMNMNYKLFPLSWGCPGI